MTVHYYLPITDVAYGANNPPAVEHGKPVLVIDPENAEQIAELGRALEATGALHYSPAYDDPAITQAVRDLMFPPRVVEQPTGLGAVVRDNEGVAWVLNIMGGWDCAHSYDAVWSQVAAVEVLQAGWSE